MELKEAIVLRHSVRAYLERPLEGRAAEEMRFFVDQCNRESGLNMQLVLNEPRAFDCRMAHYGKFSGVTSYIAIVGRKEARLEEKAGYYGEKVVLRAQQLGLNTCWVGLTFKKIKDAFLIGEGQKCVAVIALGYGASQGKARRSKLPEQVYDVRASQGKAYAQTPDWFRRGVEMALLAPTAINQQKFLFALNGERVRVRAGRGFYSKVDLGIVKYHFEVGAAPKDFRWG